jgi:hypothetical protein
MKRTAVVIIALACLVLIFPSCSYTLKLNGSSIPQGMKTIRVDFFENNATLVVNTLSQQFTESLKARIRSTTSLSIVRGDAADGVISGNITDYHIAPISVAPIAGASALTITVKVKYVNDLRKTDGFEESFTKSENFTGDIATREQSLIADLNKQIIEDIFNRAFAQW